MSSEKNLCYRCNLLVDIFRASLHIRGMEEKEKNNILVHFLSKYKADLDRHFEQAKKANNIIFLRKINDRNVDVCKMIIDIRLKGM